MRFQRGSSDDEDKDKGLSLDETVTFQSNAHAPMEKELSSLQKR